MLVEEGVCLCRGRGSVSLCIEGPGGCGAACRGNRGGGLRLGLGQVRVQKVCQGIEPGPQQLRRVQRGGGDGQGQGRRGGEQGFGLDHLGLMGGHWGPTHAVKGRVVRPFGILGEHRLLLLLLLLGNQPW